MAGDAPLIRLNNGIEVTGETKCYFDPRRIRADAINCISHAHSDHLPKRSTFPNGLLGNLLPMKVVLENVRPPEVEAMSLLKGYLAGEIAPMKLQDQLWEVKAKQDAKPA